MQEESLKWHHLDPKLGKSQMDLMQLEIQQPLLEKDSLLEVLHWFPWPCMEVSYTTLAYRIAPSSA